MFALPFFGVAYYLYAGVSATALNVGTEEEGVRFAGDAVRLLQLVAALPLDRPVAPNAQTGVEMRFNELDGIVRSFKNPKLESDVMWPVREKTWKALRGRVSAANLGPFEDELQHSTALISDASKLSFESDVVVGDLQDAALDVNPHVLRYLTLATATAVEGDRSGREPVRDRIELAGLLAQASVASSNANIDMHGAFDNDAGVKAKLSPMWTATNDDAQTLSNHLAVARDGSGPAPDAESLLARRNRLLRDSGAYTNALEDEIVGRLHQRIVEADRMHVLIVVLALLAPVLIYGITASVARSILRRDRRELRRVQQEAQMLTTELARRSAELARQNAERALQLTEAQFRAVFDRSHMGIALLDAGGGTIESNAAVSDLLGAGGRIVEPGDARFVAIAEGRAKTYVFEREVNQSDGTVRWAEVNVSVVAVSAPSNVVAVAMVRDITERKAVDTRLRYAATHDQVTSLPNRTAFVRHLEELIARRRTGAADYAVLFIDLDDFKVANDRFGHHAGDRLLVVTARRLLSLSGPQDLVARFHGDEFAILLGSVSDAAEAMSIAQHVQDVVRAPVQIDGNAVAVTSSIGVVLGSEAYVRAEDVVRNADAAMYHAKSLGHGMSVLFDDAMQHRLALRMRLMSDLQAGLGRGEFHLAYQPVVDLLSGEPEGLEALMRWHHPSSGLIPPANFHTARRRVGRDHRIGALRVARSMHDAVARVDPRIPRSADDERQPLGHAADGTTDRRGRGRSATCQRAGTGAADARDHGKRVAGRRAPRRDGPRPAQGAGRTAVHRRLRNGLFVASIPAQVPDRRAENRPLVRQRPERRPRERADRADGRDAGALARDGRHRRRRRERDPTAQAHGARLQERARIPVRTADGDGSRTAALAHGSSARKERLIRDNRRRAAFPPTMVRMAHGSWRKWC